MRGKIKKHPARKSDRMTERQNIVEWRRNMKQIGHSSSSALVLLSAGGKNGASLRSKISFFTTLCVGLSHTRSG